MNHSFNLVDHPWIPCITTEGKYVEVGLFELLSKAHELREICGETPLVTAAIFPVALAILHRVFGPSGIAEWASLWNKGAFDEARLEAYFRQWYSRFELFGEGNRFYQRRNQQAKPKSLIHLVHSIGNNGTLFTHYTDKEGITLNPAESARQLVTAQYFHGAGTSGLPQKFTDSIFTRGVLFFAEGMTLFETFMANLIRYPDERVMPTTPYDKPAWEMDANQGQRQIPLGYLDYLTWQSTQFWLLPEETNGEIVVREAIIAPALRLDKSVFSPFKRYMKKSDKKKDDFSFMYFSDKKALWRDYHTLVTLLDGSVKPPAVIEWLAVLSNRVNNLPTIKMMAIGMLAGKAKQIFYRQERMSLPHVFLQDEAGDLKNAVESAIVKATEVEDHLKDALKKLAREVVQRGATGHPTNVANLTIQWNATSVYWASLEVSFWMFISHLAEGKDDAMLNWEQALRKYARESLRYAQQLAGTSPSALKGGVLAENILNFRLNKIIPLSEKEG